MGFGLLFRLTRSVHQLCFTCCGILLDKWILSKETRLTLLDVLKLMRHYIKTVVAVIIVGTLVGAGLGVAKAGLGNAEYSAEAVLTISEPTATVSASELMPLTQAVATNVVAENASDDVSVSQKYDLAARTISFTAISSSEAESIVAANNAAAQTAEQTAAVLQEMAERYRAEIATEELIDLNELDGKVTFGLSERDKAAALGMVSFTVNDASQAASNSGKSTVAKYTLVGFLGGLLLSICIVAIINSFKEPLKGREDVEKLAETVVLAEGDARGIGDRLWANIRFATGEIPRVVCLIPVGRPVSREFEESLNAAIASTEVHDVSVIACSPLSQNMSAAYTACDADISVVYAVYWEDSIRQLEDTLHELNLAHADIAGVVLVESGQERSRG